MASKLYEEQQEQNKKNSLGGMFQRFMKNPFQALAMAKYNIPEEYSNDPEKAVQYMLDTNQTSQEKLNRIFSIAQKMGVKF